MDQNYLAATLRLLHLQPIVASTRVTFVFTDPYDLNYIVCTSQRLGCLVYMRTMNGQHFYVE